MSFALEEDEEEEEEVSHTTRVGGGQSAVGTRVEGGVVQEWCKLTEANFFWNGTQRGGLNERKTIG